jgi:cysteinyl-tRNA synthetase
MNEKAFEPVKIKPINPIELPRHPSSRRHVSHKKHVHFTVVSNDDNVQVETIRYELAPAKYKSKLAWKTDEIKGFQQECRDMADFHKTNEDYVACIHHLFACKKSAPATSGNEADDDDDNVPQNPSVRHDTTAIRMLSKSPARGLEARVAPIIRAHRQWGVTVVLATQAKLNKCKVTDREKREKMLRARSLQISKRSRVFALKLAQGDASEALMVGQR